MKKLLLILISIFGLNYGAYSQSTLSTYPTITANNSFDQVLFEVTPNQPIILESISNVFFSGTGTVEIYIRPGGYTSPPGTVNAAGGWVNVANVTTTVTNTSVPTLIPTNLNYFMNANTTYGIAVHGGTTLGSQYHTHATTDANTYTDGTVTITVGTVKGWGGAFPTPANNPRDFVGSITYSPASTGPNDAGTRRIVEPLDTCAGQYDVKAEIQNYGTNKINQVQVNWSINGLPQPPFSYTSTLDTINGTGPNTAIVTLGTVNLPANAFTDIAVWTSMPNGVTDTAIRNDSALASSFAFAYPTIDLGIDTTICPGEPISLDGGIRDSLRWQNNTNNQILNVSNAGQYSIKVYENGCESRDTINVTLFPAAPTVNFGADTILCFGETLLLDATTPGVTYTWQDNSTGPTFTVDTIGKYTVILEDANTCNSEEEIRVDYYTEPSVLLIVSPRNEICNQTPYLFRAFPTTQGSVAFQWRVNGVATGAVTTDATFAGPVNYGDSVSVDLITDICSTSVYPVPSDKIEMILNPAPKSINGKTTVIENTSGIYLVPLTPTSSYVWRVSGGTIVGDSTNNNVNIKWGGPNPNATLTLVETDQSNCVRENLIDVDVVSIIGFNELENNLELGEAYPNPSSNIVTIPVLTTSNMMIDMSLIDISGKLVTPIYNGMITGDKQIKLDVTEIKSGLYFYKIITSDGYQTVRKLTVQH